MVGVPRNTSCHECLKRRVKCDQARPECRRCLARGFQCPGYQRTLRFYNKSLARHEFTDARSFDGNKRDKEDVTNHSESHRPLAIAPRPTIDDIFASNLATKALDLQTRDVFYYTVQATFPGTFATFANRVSPNWVDFIRHSEAAQSPSIKLGITGLNTLYLGMKHRDQEMINRSRHVYGLGLRYLIGMIRNPRTRTSDITLGVAILLGIFEMLDGLETNSWLIHSRGIGELFRLRGARAHRQGFGRTLFVTYRSFHIAESFAQKEPCFLESPEWRSATQDIISQEERSGRGSWLGIISDQAFNELCLGPGFLSQTTALITATHAPAMSREELISRITHSRNILRYLQRKLASVSGLEVKLKEIDKLNQDDNLIAPEFVHPIADFSLQGICSGLALLNQLLVLLETDKKRTSDEQGHALFSAWGPSSTYQVEPAADLFGEHQRPLNWLDQVAMSMGTLTLQKNP